jgi:hypothetical protein
MRRIYASSFRCNSWDVVIGTASILYGNPLEPGHMMGRTSEHYDSRKDGTMATTYFGIQHNPRFSSDIYSLLS